MFGIEPGDTLLLLADVKQGIAFHRMDFFTRMAEAIFRRGRGDSDYSEGEKSFAEAVLREAEERQAAGVLDRQSLVQLLLTPLMSGEMARKERILKSLKMIRGEQAAVDEAEKRQMESVLYALAMKFLTKEELEEVWEVFRMTVLGEILVEHGKEIGIEAFILDNLEENIPRDRIIDKLVRRFSLTRESAESYFHKFVE